MDDPNHFGSSFCDCGRYFFRGEDFSERTLNPGDFRANTFSNIGHTAAENTVNTHDHPIAGFDQIHNTRLHSGAASAADRHRHVVFRLKHFAQHRLNFVHHFQEIGVEVSDRRSRQGCQYTWMNVAGAGSHEDSLWR